MIVFVNFKFLIQVLIFERLQRVVDKSKGSPSLILPFLLKPHSTERTQI